MGDVVLLILAEVGLWSLMLVIFSAGAGHSLLDDSPRRGDGRAMIVAGLVMVAALIALGGVIWSLSQP